VVKQNLQAEFNKASVHPVLQSTVPGGSGLAASSTLMAKPSAQVTCSDCHDSHASKKSIATAPGPDATGPILGVSGVNRAGAVVNPIEYEYELCFRCHGDKAVHAPATVNRLVVQPDMRLAFSPSNSSFHPVVQAGKNVHVPSLLAPYRTTTMIKCTDCHNNDQGPGAGGTGPSGPHGSAYAPLLERQLITTDQVVESLQNYALCYKCHNRNSILSDQSFRAFNSLGQDRGHRFHIVDQKTACTTCHDSHGVAFNAHLINFNPNYVTAGSKELIQYNSTGLFRGNCTLTCHGFDHEQSAYPQLLVHPASVARLPRKTITITPLVSERRIF
jgi:hypothetical protein